MFVRLKNGLLYGVFSNGIDDFMFTHDAEKADSGFERVRDKYRKKIEPDSAEIEECFEAVFKVRFDVGIPGVKDLWVIDRASDILHDKMVLWSGNIDGWDFHENGVSSKEFDFRDAEEQFMEKIVFADSGKVHRKPKIIRTMLTKEEFKKAIVLYDERNV